MHDEFNPEEMAPDPVPLAAFQHFRSGQFALGSALIFLLMAAIYYQVLGKLVIDWWQLPDFSHGFLVPIFAAYLVWDKRTVVRDTRIAPSWNGIAVMALGIAVLLLGIYGSELFLSRVSLVIVLAGLVLCFGGRPLLKELRFALLVLLLAIPLPTIVFNQITFPLQILASKLASGLLPLFAVPVLREGNVIVLPAMKLEVAEACSGIRSLVSLLTLGIMFGYFTDQRGWVRVFIALSTIPIAIVANAARVAGTGIAAHRFGPEAAEGFLHESAGMVVFAVAFVLMIAVQRLLVRLAPPPPESAQPIAMAS